MNFGIQLPGPFRVGMSSKGRMSVGASLGPLSVSTGVGGRRSAVPGETYHPTTLDDAVGQMVAGGWRLTGHDGQTALLSKGWTALQITAAPGGVTWQPVTSRRKVLFWLAVAAVAVALIGVATS